MAYRITLENVEQYHQWENEKKALEKKLEQMKKDFIEQMKKEGLEEKPVGHGKGLVTYRNNPQHRFNQKRFGADYPELLKKYKDLTDSWSLKVD